MNLKPLLHAATYGFLLGSALVMTVTFMFAYFQPDKAITVYIDSYNEANVELVWLILSWATMAVYFFMFGRKE